MDEEKRRLQSTREEVGDSSGGRRIDLESGTVTIARRSKDGSPAADAEAGDSEAIDGDAGDGDVAHADAADDGSEALDTGNPPDAGDPDAGTEADRSAPQQ